MRFDLKLRLKEFYNQLVDRPLEPTDAFYEPFAESMGSDGDPIDALATRITWSEAASVNLLSGQRGSGKSTELRRLAASCGRRAARYFCATCATT